MFSVACIWKRLDIAKFVFEQRFHELYEEEKNSIDRKREEKELIHIFLCSAIREEQLDIIKFVTEMANKKQMQINIFDTTYLKIASLKIFKMLFEEELKNRDVKATVQNIDLQFLCEEHMFDFVMYVLEQAELYGINLFQWTNELGQTLLHCACNGKGSKTQTLKSVKIVKYLIEKWPAAVEAKDYRGYTPLHELAR